MPTFKSATVVYHATPAPKFNDVVLETHEPVSFKPGQFVTVEVAPNEIRSYSIAGKLDGNKIGLMVDSSPGGHGSQYFDRLKAGDPIRFMGPFGNFVFNPDDGSKQIVFMATGCGVAPIKAMIEAALREYHVQTPITFYFGLRYPSDIFWDTYFNELQAQYPNFKFKLCLSKPDDSWRGSCGHITDLVKQDYPDGKELSAYICGNNKMATEAVEVLKSLGCPEQRIYHEQYG